MLDDGTVQAFGKNSSGQTTLPDFGGKHVMQVAAASHTVMLLKATYVSSLTLTDHAIEVATLAGDLVGQYDYSGDLNVGKIKADIRAKTGRVFFGKC